MTARRAARTTIGAALREKFKSPREALKRLGIDERLLRERDLAYDGATKMKPNRLQYLLVTRAARIFNPQLAADAKVDYAPLFKGVTTKNLKARKPTIIGDAKKLLKGKTLAKDASIDGLAHLLDKLEHPPNEANLDESVSPEQHRAMGAAAGGHSNLGIPKSVGEEFTRADKGKFADAMPAFLRGKGMDEESIKEAMDMFHDNLPENALDEGENVEIEVEEAEGKDGMVEQEEGEDEEIEQEEAESETDDELAEMEGDRKHADDRRGAKDRRHAKDRKHADDRRADDRRGARDSAMDTKKFMTIDAANKAIEAAVKKERANVSETMDARTFVRPYVGELSMALDSAEKVLRAAAESMGIEEADKIHASALKTIIKLTGSRAASQSSDRSDMAHDTSGVKSFAERFPGAARIGSA